jgi:hypothetical protein
LVRFFLWDLVVKSQLGLVIYTEMPVNNKTNFHVFLFFFSMKFEKR